MNSLLSLGALRCAGTRALPRPAAAFQQVAFISLRPSPTFPRLHQNAADKIPPNQRPLNRGPDPPPTATEEDLAKLSYLVRRTASSQVPIYRKWKAGGTQQVILLKKIDGDRRKLLDDIVEGLDVPRDDIRLNSVTQHIELKGDYLDKTLDWLLERGF